MAEVDASITANAGKNALGALGQMAETMNAVNQNRLFIGREVAGRALQQSINPQTGEIDFARFNKLITANPRVAPYAQEALSQALAQRGQDILNTTSKAKLTEVYSANIRQDIGATTSPSAALLAIQRGIAAGRYPKEFAVGFIGDTDLNALVKEAAIASGSETAMEAQFGTPGTVDTGGEIKAVTTNRITGQRTAMGGDAAEIDKELSPETLATRVPMVGPNNVPVSVPQSALVDETGQPKVSALTGPSGEIKTGLAPGVSEAAGTAGQASANMAMALVQRASKAPENKAILGNMDGLLDEFTPGPQSGFWKKFGQVAAEYGIKVPGAPPKDKVAAQEEFGKLAFQLAQSQFQALGGTGTNAQLDSTMHTSPSEFLTREGSKNIISLLKGNEDAISAQADAWERWQQAGNGPETYGRFVNQWNKIYDPRVFQSQYMTPESRKTMLNGMSKAERKKFEASYKQAVGLGWVTP